MDIPHPPEVVFRYLADPRNRPEWQASLLSVTMRDRSEPHVGMTWRDNTVVGVRPSMEIVELAPFKVVSEAGRWHGMGATLTLRFTGVGTGCRVHATGTISGSGPWRVPARAAGRLAGPTIRRDLARAGEILTRGRISR